MSNLDEKCEHREKLSKTVIDSLVSNESIDGLRLVETQNKDLSNYLNIYAKFLDALKLSGENSHGNVITSFCLQSLKNSNVEGLTKEAKLIDEKTKNLKELMDNLQGEWIKAKVIIHKDHKQSKELNEETINFQKRSKAHLKDVKLLEAHLLSTGYNPSLREREMNCLAEENEKLRLQLDDVNEKVGEFADFEPNEGSLMEEIERIQKEIRKYDKIFSRESL